jgi:hypothetical protein
MRVIGRMFGGRQTALPAFSFRLCMPSLTSAAFFSSASSPFHRVIVIGSLSLHSEVMNAVCQIAHARFSEEAASPTGARADGRASPTSPPVFNFTSSAMPPIACISTTLHSHMARALFWDSEFRCSVVCGVRLRPRVISIFLWTSGALDSHRMCSAVRDAVACDRCVPVDAMRVTFDSRSM